jgi:penicillin V acylase-like amidase (Ntn superfamily)
MDSMKHLIIIILLSISLDIYAARKLNPMTDTSSCSTILFIQNDSLFIGHNLDEDFETTGLVIVNKRGISKREVSWSDYNSPSGLSKARIHWKSKYGSIVYSTLGKEFIDGGMNEAGLYIGEMTLIDTKFPEYNKLPKVNGFLWMQYVLDNFESVEQVIKDLDYVANDGPNPWHYFISDRKGDVVTIEFIDGKLLVHRKSEMPVLALCNTQYDKEVERLKEYKNYGGERELSLNISGNDTRFLVAAKMLNDSSEYNKSRNAIDYTFKILTQLYGKDNNRWSIVYDALRLRMYFNTNNARQIRFVDFKDFDFSADSPAMILDIREKLEGNVSKYFVQYNDSTNRLYIDKLLKACNCEEGANQLSTFFSNSAKEIELKKKK